MQALQLVSTPIISVRLGLSLLVLQTEVLGRFVGAIRLPNRRSFGHLGTSLLAKAFRLRHIGDAGEVAERLKAAVC
jgi:hypothetical protein